MPTYTLTTRGVLLIGLLAIAPQGEAQFVMTLTGSPGSSIVNFSLTGSDIAEQDFDSFSDGLGFNISDGYDPFPLEINGPGSPPLGAVGVFDIVSGGATIVNNQSGATVTATSLYLQDSDFAGVDRFGVSGTGGVDPTTGESITWSGSGTIDLSPRGLTFDDLTPGSGVGFFFAPTFDLGLDGILIIVPEPSSLALLAGLLAVPSTRRR